MTTRTITLTLTVTDAEANALINRFTTQANASSPEALGTAPSALPSATVDDDETGPVDPNAGDTDVRGVKWHPEYHAATKGKNQDGTWKSRRGHDKDALAAYEASFAGTGALAAPAAAPVAQPALEVPAFLQKPGMPTSVPAAPMPTAPVPAPVMPYTYENMLDAFGRYQERHGAAIGSDALTGIYQAAELPIVNGQWDTNALSVREDLRRKVGDLLDKT